ncbi:MAG: S8 family serine peptidase [Nanoarchaeota archaeon]
MKLMLKRIFLIRSMVLIILLLISINLTLSNPNIENEVVEKLENYEYVNVTIKLKDQSNTIQENILTMLDEVEFRIKSTSITGRGFTGSISKRGFDKLKFNVNIESIYASRIGHITLKESKPIIKTPEIWDLGFKGDGETICILDTGIDTDHTAFKNKITDERCYCTASDSGSGGCCPDSTNQQNGTGSSEDDNGHGTHVAGIAVGNGFRVKGIAKDSNVVMVKVCDSLGDCEEIDVSNGIDWCWNNYNLSGISLSLRFFPLSDNPLECNGIADRAVNDAYGNGTSVIVASGNDASASSIGSPACALGAFSVGATYDQDVGSKSWSSCTDNVTFNDKITCFSNRDEILDILAPGSVIKSAKMGSFFFLEERSGTSQAAPHVSGAIALLKEADDTNSVTNSPMHVRELLKETGKQIYDSASGLRIPRLNILAAFQIDWPMFHHDLRRTGLTLLKGDLDKTDIDQASFTIDSIDNTFIDFPVLADVDRDEQQEILVGLSRFGATNTLFGAFYAIECIEKKGRCKNFRELWSFSDGSVLKEAPTVDDLNNDFKSIGSLDKIYNLLENVWVVGGMFR